MLSLGFTLGVPSKGYAGSCALGSGCSASLPMDEGTVIDLRNVGDVIANVEKKTLDVKGDFLGEDVNREALVA
jgi:hypothetical protein